MSTIRECDLPGIGRKFQVDTRSGDKLVIILHDDGKRELHHFHYEDPEESLSSVTLDDDEARQVAGIIGGLTYKPRALETVEVALDELTIEWYKVDPASRVVGQTVGQLQIRQQTGASIIAIIEKDHTRKISPGADQIIRAEATLVVAGERQQVKALKHLLQPATA